VTRRDTKLSTNKNERFATFFRERFSRTTVVLIAMGASRADADDCVQEAMLLAWKSWDTIREPEAWVKTVAARRYWRLIRTGQQEILLDEAPPVADDACLDIFTDEQQYVLRLLRQLPTQQRTIAALFYDGMATEEIAELVGVKPDTVRSHLRHARTSLKGLLESKTVLHLLSIA
jgi:RNA polymerase sigma factor (sigma-70 family)